MKAGDSMNEKGIKADLSSPIREFRWSLAPNETRKLTFADGAVLFFAEATANATGGNVMIRFGETGDFFRLVRGDLIRTAGFREVSIQEVGGLANVVGIFLISADVNFSFENYDRGLAAP